MKAWFSNQAIYNALNCALLSESELVASELALHHSKLYCVQGEGWIEFEKLGVGLCAFEVSNPVIPRKSTFLSCSLLQTKVEREKLCSHQQTEREEETRIM